MAVKTKKKKEKKKIKSKGKPKKPNLKKSKTKGKSGKPKTKKSNEPLENIGIVIVDDDLTIDKEKEIEERKAYLEEARSQDAYD